MTSATEKRAFLAVALIVAIVWFGLVAVAAGVVAAWLMGWTGRPGLWVVTVVALVVQFVCCLWLAEVHSWALDTWCPTDAAATAGGSR